MKWIKDIEGDLLNAYSIDVIFIESVGRDYPKPYRVKALMNGDEYLLAEFHAHIEAKDLVIDMWLKLNR